MHMQDTAQALVLLLLPLLNTPEWVTTGMILTSRWKASATAAAALAEAPAASNSRHSETHNGISTGRGSQNKHPDTHSPAE